LTTYEFFLSHSIPSSAWLVLVCGYILIIPQSGGNVYIFALEKVR